METSVPLTQNEQIYRHVIFEGATRPAASARRVASCPQRQWVRPSPAAHRADIPALTPEETGFLAWLLGCEGLDVKAYRQRPLKRRLAACLRLLKCQSIDHAAAVLQQSPRLISGAIDSLLIGVTEFFRDGPVFDDLRERVLPELLRAQAVPPRVWSVGCSDGAELYSVAMMLAEMNALTGARLLGTDCRTGAIEQARRGLFSPSAVEKLPTGLVGRYFREEKAGLRVAESIRQAAVWQVGDALQTEYEALWDMVLCRNLTIYLEAASAQRLWERLGRALRPGGILVVGKAERPMPGIGMSRIAPCIYLREGGGQ